MAEKTKKILLFIVEGPTDEDTLSPVFKKIFQNEYIRFHVVHGDLTSERLINSNNAKKTVHEHIKNEMDRYGFRRSDVVRVIHLIDTDGAFIPDAHIIPGSEPRLCYEENQIISPNVSKTIERNQRKSLVLQRLYTTGTIGNIPYSVYYFSRNLEHVLHNTNGLLTDDEKMEYADTFSETYDHSPDAFIRFLSDSDFTVTGSYSESWRFIFSDLNSLHRHCNLHLLFQDEP